MRADIPELLFSSREDFREWLKINAQTSQGVWLIFGKTKALVTITANDALEEALCFGWIDGQLKSIDSIKYMKYFAKRRPKSVWSEKNKKAVDLLRQKGIMTELGEYAVEMAKMNGIWDASNGNLITEEQIEALAEKLRDISPAFENFNNMSQSVRRTYAGRYFSFKTEEDRQRDFERIVERLNKNLKPM